MKLLIYLFALFLFACGKEYDNFGELGRITLPIYSETGAQTMGFILNDSPWTILGRHRFPNGAWSENKLFPRSTSGQILCPGRMSIVKDNTPIIDISVWLTFTPTFPFVQNYSLTNESTEVFDIIKGKRYIIDSLHPITLQLNKFEKIGNIERICSGRFFGVLYNFSDRSDSIFIKDGRFDIRVIYE